MWGFISGICILFLWFLCLSLCHNCFDSCGFVVCSKLGTMRTPTLFFFFRLLLAIWGPLKLDMDFRMNFSISTKNTMEILLEIVLHLYVEGGGCVFLTLWATHAPLGMCIFKLYDCYCLLYLFPLYFQDPSPQLCEYLVRPISFLPNPHDYPSAAHRRTQVPSSSAWPKP